MRWVILLLGILWAGTLAAQGTDGSRVERLIERSLSGDGRVVELTKFEGALSSRARFDRLTIADADGIWLTIEDAALDWDITALRRGTLEVTELSAASIDFARAPVASGAEVSDSEASDLSIPNLPVVLQVDRVAVPELRLGPDLMGEEMRLTLSAAARLADGGLTFDFDATRTDGAEGRFDIALAYDPETGVLQVTTDLQEPEGGLVARSLGIPDAPALALGINGTGPLDSFVAEIGLTTNGSERLAGTVTLTGQSDAGRAFDAQLSGDIRPLLTPENRAFFGDETLLDTAGALPSEGGLRLDRLAVRTAQLTLDGSATLAPGGAPQRIALTGRLEDAQRPIKLPGSAAELASADLALAFDAAQSDAWQLSAVARDVRSGDFSIARLDLSGTGLLRPAEDVPFDGRLSAEIADITFADPATANAVGPRVTLSSDLSVTAEGHARLSDMRLETETMTLTGAAQARPVEGQIDLTLDATLDAPDLRPFAGLTAPLRAGALSSRLSGTAQFPSGVVAVSLDGETSGLDIGVTPLGALLEPKTTLDLDLRRDAEGTVLERFALSNPSVTANGTARLSSTEAQLDLTAGLADIALIEPSLPGAATLTLKGSGAPDARSFDGVLTIGTDYATLDGDLTARPVGAASTRLTFAARTDVADLAPFGEIAAPLRAGRLGADLTASLLAPEGTLSVALNGTSDALDIGQPRLAPLLSPRTTLTLRASRDGPQLALDALTLANPAMTASGAARLDGGALRATLQAALSDISTLEPKLSGPVTLSATTRGDLDAGDLAATYTAKTRFAELTGTAQTNLNDPDRDLTFDTTLTAQSLAPLARIAAPLKGGQAEAQISGRMALASGDATVALTGETQGLDIGVPVIAPLLSPRTTLSLDLIRAGTDLTLRDVSLTNPALSAEGALNIGDTASRANVTARLTNLGQIVAALPGPVRLDAEATDLLGTPSVTARVESGSGIRANLQARLGQSMDLTTDGTVPLALAQPFLGTRLLAGLARFDLALRGTPSLANLAGQITAEGARFSDPELGLVISPLATTVALRGGQAAITASGTANGGPLRAEGTIGLAAPFALNLRSTLSGIAIRYRDFLRTTLGGNVTLAGAATGRLAVGGALTLSDTEIRVPDTGLGLSDPVPYIRHVGASRAVQQTLNRAGVTGPAPDASSSGPPIALDLLVRTASSIFVRGRGLDAEFDGGVRLGGTVANPVPVGRFDLRRGRLSFLGRRLDITTGEIAAAGNLIPRLAIVAEAVTPDVTAQIKLDGPADAPQLTLSSVPELPEDEVLARILFGKSATQLSPFQVARLISSLAQLSGRGGGGVLDKTRAQLGFDDLDLRQDADTGAAELAIGRYVSESVYSEVEIGAGGNARINLNLDLTDNTKLRGSVGSDGDTGIGVFWQKDY